MELSPLTKSIEALYDAFRDVPRPARIEGCPCCISGDEIRILLSKPLRELKGENLTAYSSSAFLTVGSQSDYLYFLPRIVDLACSEPGWWPDPEIVGRAIGETKPRTWRPHRTDALINVVNSVIHSAIEDENWWNIDEWICASAKMGLDVGIFLEQISCRPKALLGYYERNSESLVKDKLGNAFWDKGDEWHDKIVSWFSSPEISRMISDSYGITTSEDGPDDRITPPDPVSEN